MFAILIASAALALSATPAQKQAGNQQLDQLIDRIETLYEDAAVAGDTSASMDSIVDDDPQPVKPVRPMLRMTFKNGNAKVL